MNSFNGLSNKLGIDYIEATPVIEQSEGANVPVVQANTAVAVVAANRTQDEEEDYQKSREIYTKVAEVGIHALGELSVVAGITNEPRAYEVIATLMKSLNETAKQMNETHAARAPQKQAAGMTIDKAVFVGSQTELLKAIKNGNTDSTE